MSIPVYVPREGYLELIDRGSGIVGSRTRRGELRLDFEGNRYGAANIITFADRVRHAYGRHVSSYPTVARVHAREEAVVEVGTFYPDLGTIHLWGREAERLLAAWLSVGLSDHVPLDELKTTEAVPR